MTRLEQHGPLSDEEKQAVLDMTAHTRAYTPNEEIVPERSAPKHSCLILEGFAIRHKHLADGRRQITAFHVPGDFADLHSLLLRPLDDGVGALTPCRVALVSHSDLRRVTMAYRHLTRLLWFLTLVDGAVHRAWITAIGTMDARERLSHFLCELRDRLQVTGLVKDHGYQLPITQEVLSDALGMTGVHVNRTLGKLREEGLISSKGRHLAINDWEALKEVGQYDPDYLHIQQRVERD